MRVESCGPLAEGEKHSFYTYNLRLSSEPITTLINPKANRVNNLLNEDDLLVDEANNNLLVLESASLPATNFFLAEEEEEWNKLFSGVVTAEAPSTETVVETTLCETGNNEELIPHQNDFSSSDMELNNNPSLLPLLGKSGEENGNPVHHHVRCSATPSVSSCDSFSVAAPSTFLRQVPDTIPSHPDPIICPSSSIHEHEPFGSQPKRRCGHAHYFPACEESSYFEDWQNQSSFLASQVDKLHQVQEENSNLATFLSKFDSKVAAIWNGGHANPATEVPEGLVYPKVLPQQQPQQQPLYQPVESYLSTSSTPVGGSMYPWANTNSPLRQQNYPPLVQRHEQEAEYDFFYLHEQALKSREKMSASYHHKPKPEEGEVTYFTGDEWDDNAEPSYFIFRKGGIEEDGLLREESIRSLNHNDNSSGFVPFVKEFEVKFDVNGDFELDPALLEMQVSAMQEILQGLELSKPKSNATAEESSNSGGGSTSTSTYEQDSEDDFCSEVFELLRSQPKTFYEQPIGPQVSLISSWNTHFTPIDVIEKMKLDKLSSPPGIFRGDETNLPQYYLFSGNEKEYNIFNRPAKTLFPIRYRIQPKPEKGTQVDEAELLRSATEDLMDKEVEGINNGKKGARGHDPFTVFDWSTWGLPSTAETHKPVSRTFSRTPGSRTSSSRNVLQNINLYSGLSGSGTEAGASWQDLSSMGSMIGTGGVDYGEGCDSGIGIDGSSRAGFYEDFYPEQYETLAYPYEKHGASVAGSSVWRDLEASHPLQFDSNTDFGMFWTCSNSKGKAGKDGSSTTSGKKKKGNKGNKNKLCKYFKAEGTCKRGKDCKFAHDFVPCRYWAEGSCLKGEACPYPHFFIERNDAGQFDREKYKLESENDFPSLSDPDPKALNKMMSSRVENIPSVDVYYAGVGGLDSAAGSESLLMLADPAGSMYPYEASSSYLSPSWTSMSSHGRNQNQHINDNNNWISSSLMVKEKRKKNKSKKI